MTRNRNAPLTKTFISRVYHSIACWVVVRAALLLLGCWCAFPQPYGHSIL